jgi:hypothetical protein
MESRPRALPRAAVLGRREGSNRAGGAQTRRAGAGQLGLRLRPDRCESGHRFGAHAFRPGEYVSIRDEDGEMHTFQVVSVETAAI